MNTSEGSFCLSQLVDDVSIETNCRQAFLFGVRKKTSADEGMDAVRAE